MDINVIILVKTRKSSGFMKRKRWPLKPSLPIGTNERQSPPKLEKVWIYLKYLLFTLRQYWLSTFQEGIKNKIKKNYFLNKHSAEQSKIGFSSLLIDIF